MKSKCLKLIVLLVVMAIPVIYSFFYLKAYWDPYGNLQDLKIAMVNLDEGFEGENQGQKFVDTMVENGTFNICVVEEKKGDDGLKNGEYYAEIKIPADFSKNLYSAKTENKQISEIIYSPNQKSNYLASQIMNSAIKTIELNLQAKITEKVTENLADKLNEVPDSLEEISDGTGKILDGSNTLSDGIKTLDEGAIKLKNGTDKAYSGSLEIENRVTNSINNLAQDNSDALDENLINDIGLQAGDQAIDTINARSEEIGNQAAISASNQIAEKNDSIGNMAQQMAINQIAEKSDYIGNSAEEMVSNQIANQSEEIGSQAASLASSQISSYMQSKVDSIGELAKSEALEKLNSQMETISGMASASALSSLESQKSGIYNLAVSSIDNAKKLEISTAVENQIKADPNFSNIPEAIQPYVLEYAKGAAIATAQTVAGETAVATAENITGNVASEVAEKIAIQVTGSVSKEVAMNVATEVSDEVAKQVANTTAKTVAGQVAGEVANQTAQTVANQVAGEVANQTAQTVASQVAGEVASATAQTVANQVAGEVANQTAQVVAGEVGNQVKQKAIESVVDQMGQLKNGLGQLNDGLDQIDVGTGSLVDGTERLYTGSQELVGGIDTLKTAVEDGNTDTKKELKKLDGLATFASDPVKFDEEDYGKIEQYGLSFTPLFLSIGLWVGSLMLYVVLYYDQEKRYKYLTKGAKKTYLQMALYFALAVVQGLATGVILKTALHFEVTSLGLYYFTCVLTAVTFLSIIQCLIMNLGDVGKFLALIILVLQLAASGGTFPIETVSKGFQWLNPYLPMTYTIKLIKECVVMQDKGFALNNIIILICYLVISLGITVIAEHFRRNYKKEEKNINENVKHQHA